MATIGDIGRGLQRYGLRVGEHPEFGAVGRHSTDSHHYYGEAIDVTDHRADQAPEYEGGPVLGWQERTRRLKERARQLGGFQEVLGPGDKDHDTHLHLALRGKHQNWGEQQLEWLATGRYRGADGAYSLQMPGRTDALSQQVGSAALARVNAWTQQASETQTPGAQASATQTPEAPPARVSADPADPSYWQRQDIQQWAGANATLAQRVMAKHGISAQLLQQATDPGATAGVQLR